MNRGRYYLGRVIKINLSQQQLIEAILNAPTVNIGKYGWTIADVADFREENVPFIFGKLSKYAKDGHVTVIDEIKRSQVDTTAPNLVEASSPFVYLPECSGIAFLHVWNGIQEDVFPRRFKAIIEEAYDRFLIGCDIEPISDYGAFTKKLKKLSYFTEFSATVYPPNPLFGRLWGELNEYISERNASEVTVKEQTTKMGGLKSQIIELMDKIIENPDYRPDKPAPIGDAAILMAADGYGRGKVVGIDNNEQVIIRTSDTQKSFLCSKDPSPNELASQANAYFQRISKERDMKH